MSFRCIVRIKGEPKTQVSPLQFATIAECLEFGKAMFEPPQTIEAWYIETTNEPVNFCYTAGVLKYKGGSSWQVV